MTLCEIPAIGKILLPDTNVSREVKFTLTTSDGLSMYALNLVSCCASKPGTHNCAVFWFLQN